MSYHWKPSRTKKRQFAEKMNEIEDFCRENGVTRGVGSYYFTIAGQEYCVHNCETKIKKKRPDIKYIFAGKTRLIEIYNNLKAGRALDARGY